MAHVQIRRFGDDYLIAVSLSSLEVDWWAAQGYLPVSESRRWLTARGVLGDAKHEQLAALWEALFLVSMPPPWQRHRIQEELQHEVARGFRTHFLFKEFPRGYVGARVEPEGIKPIPRLDSAHYLAVQAVDEDERPVAGVELELTLMGGDLRAGRTGSDGFVRLERLHSASAIIRVVSLDGSMWQPLDAEPAQFSSNDNRLRWHRVAQGECLSAIAHRYGLPGWKKLWQHPKNAPLRNKRKSPHVLLPGDEVAVPSLDVYEIVRPTDATHRIVVKRAPRARVKLHLLDARRAPVVDGNYQLWANDELVAEGRIQDGNVECELGVQVRDVDLVARVGGQTVRRRLHLAALDPHDALSGLQARLSNLGYYEGEIDGQESEMLARAVAEFRADAGLEGDGQIDSALHEAVEREHRV